MQLNFERKPEFIPTDALEYDDPYFSDGGGSDPLAQLIAAEEDLDCSVFEVIDITSLITKGN